MKYVVSIITFLVFLSLGFAQEDEFFVPTSSIGGYGELHYNMNKTGDDDYSKTLDFHRFVLFFSNAWTEKWSFKAELELEHNYVKNGQGELELEQAYVNYHSNNFGFQAGVLLPSVGIINEHHEPPLFFGVERPDYSKYIVPTTWFGNGAAIYGSFADFNVKLTLLEGLDGDGIDKKYAEGIRGGRMKGYKADATELVKNIRVSYEGVPNLKLSGSLTNNNAVFSDTVRPAIGVNMVELNGRLNWNNIISSFEYGQIGFTNHSVEKASGYYIDLGYDVARILDVDGNIIPWVRYTSLDLAQGHIKQDEKSYAKFMAGLTYKPISEVAFKLDYGVKTYADESLDKVTQVNLGVGYNF